MESYDYDLFVIGAGSGGVRAARVSADLGARVAVAEERFLGGTCVNVGCVPKKLFSYAAHYAHDFKDSVRFGWSTGTPSFDWPTLIANKDQEIKRLNGIYGGLLERAGCELFNGRATLVGPHTVSICGKEVTTKNILIATGGRPRPACVQGAELAISSDEAFHLKSLPKRIVIIGGGYIALEFASIFQGMGSDVTLVHRGALPLRVFDEDVRRAITDEMQRQGVTMRLKCQPQAFVQTDSGLRVDVDEGEPVVADAIMCAIGRIPNIAGLGLEAAGVTLNEAGSIAVDARFRTSAPHIYAVGDVIGRVQLTPVALAEGMSVAKDLFCQQPQSINYHNIPTAVFTYPPIATVGLTEHEAHESFKHVDVYTSEFRALKHTVGGSESRTMMKLVVDGTTDKVLGCHMLGDDSPEIIQGLAIALNCGATKAQFDATIGLHPSAAEEFVTMRQKRPPVVS